jgi:hypothetical protein
VIPDLAVITSPVSTTGAAVMIDTSKDLSVTWLPISIGQVQFELAGGWPVMDALAITITCGFEAGSGAGVVSHTLLSSLKEMSGTGPTWARLSSQVEASTMIDGLTILTQGYQNSPPADPGFNVTLE